MDGGAVCAEIRARLEAALSPEHLRIKDDSHKHAGHGGYDARGGSHIRLEIRAASLDGLSRVEKHRRIYALLEDLLETRVHALTIRSG